MDSVIGERDSKKTKPTVCIFDANRDRIEQIEAYLSSELVDTWSTNNVSEFSERVSDTQLVLAHDRKNIPEALINVIGVQQLRVPLCAYAADRDLFRVIRTIKKGAVDYFWLPFEEDFVERVLIACGEIYFPPPQEPAETQHVLDLQNLSKREYQVAEHISRGMTTDDIADTLGISTRTAEKHAQNTYKKLGIHDRADLIRARSAF